MQRADWYWLSRPLPGAGEHVRGIGIQRPRVAGEDVAVRRADCEPMAAKEPAPIAKAIMAYWELWRVA